MTEQISNERLDELLPCPFCGATPHRGPTKRNFGQNGEPLQGYKIWCPHSCAQFEQPSKELAVAAWNRRQSRSVNGIEPVGDWVVVPRIETDEMCDAGLEALRDNLGHEAVIVRDAAACYRAMIHAAPQPAKGIEPLVVTQTMREAGSAQHHLITDEDADRIFRAMVTASLSQNEKATEQSSGGGVLGYVNVYRDHDGHIELGSTDLDNELRTNQDGAASEWIEYLGRGEVRLVPADATPPEPATDILAAPEQIAESVGYTHSVEFGYTNWRGEYAVRQAVPLRVERKPSEWHGPGLHWVMVAFDLEKQAERDFRIADIGTLSSLQSVTDTGSGRAE